MKALFRPSLTARIVGQVTLCVLVLWGGAVILAAFIINGELGEAFDSGLQETARRNLPLAAALILNSPDDVGGIELPALLSADPTISNGDSGEYLVYQLRNARGDVLLQTHDAGEVPFAAPLKPGFWQDDTFRYYTEASISNTLFIQVAEPVAHRREATLESAGAVLLPVIVLVPAIVVAIWLSVRAGLAPVMHLHDEIGLRGSGNMEPVTLDHIPVELAGIETAVNTLLVRLRSALNAERAFASNSAHELRTPIASAMAQTQQLLSEMAADDIHRERAEKINLALGRLRRLSEKLLQWSRAEAGIGKSNQIQELNPIVDMVVEDIRRSNRFANRIDMTGNGTPLRAAIDPDAFGICAGNLLENALMHGAAGQPVLVRMDGPDTLIVENAGAVIPADILAGLTRRFERYGNHPGSSGLGLSIVSMIMEQSDGELTLMSPRPGAPDGFMARLSLLAKKKRPR
ncbi:MAG: histidine kinase dimerization/phospho-acceptor domain-containing protein [Pseudomonadota bacterium]